MPHLAHINPRDDTDFVSLAEREAKTAECPEDLQVRLRVEYPAAVVRPRGLSSEAVDIWYVYRDGAWRPGGFT